MANGNAVLVVAETSRGELSAVTAEAIGAARSVAEAQGGEVVVALLGSNVGGLATSLAEAGADIVLLADDPQLASYQAETYVPVLARAAREISASVVLLGQTLIGREMGPRLAFDLDSAITTDCTRLQLDGDRLVMTKPIYGGSAMADYVVETTPQVATIRPRAFEPSPRQPGRTCDVQALAVDLDPSSVRTEVVETVTSVGDGGPTLKDAKVIVAGGRGLGGPENWHYVEELAQTLGGAVGATRAVTDAGWVPVSLQVGLTGATVSPDLYIAVGISGAVQHLAGITGARNVVAINKDPESNIFKVARYGVVGDWKEIVPAFTQKVKELRAG